jgi:hypothetical protein
MHHTEENQHESLIPNCQIHLPWSCQLTAVSLNFWGGGDRLWYCFMLDHFDHRSLFTLGMGFSPIKTSVNTRYTQQHVAPPLGPMKHIIFWTVNGCSTSNAYAIVGCNIMYCSLPFSKMSSLTLQCSRHIQWLAEHEHAGLRLHYSLQKTYCTTHRHLHVTGSLPSTVHLTREEFLLVSLSLGIWWYNAVLL